MNREWDSWPIVVCDSKNNNLIESINNWLESHVPYENFFQSCDCKNHLYINDPKTLTLLQLKWPVKLTNTWKYKQDEA